MRTFDTFKLLKVGDIFIEKNSTSKKKFVVNKFFGSEYLVMVSCYSIKKNNSNANLMNIPLNEILLIDSNYRPYKKLDKRFLMKMIKNKNLEAKREFIIRNNSLKQNK